MVPTASSPLGSSIDTCDFFFLKEKESLNLCSVNYLFRST